MTVTVTDGQGASSNASLNVAVGNEAPIVKFESPQDGGFLDGNDLSWKVNASDAEDGEVPAERLLIQVEKRNRATVEDLHPGLALMKRTTCFACHNAKEQSAGPPYAAVAKKYAGEPDAREKLQEKILKGGAGVWGALPMPPHPQHTPAEASLMVDWVLSLAQREIATLPSAAEGKTWIEPDKTGFGKNDNTVISLTAGTMDKGLDGLPPLRSTAEVLLRGRRQRAACFDRAERAIAQDNLDQGGLVARILPGGWIGFDRIRLQDFETLKLSAWPQGTGQLTVSIFAGDVELARRLVPAVEPAGGKAQTIAIKMPPAGAHGIPQQVRVKVDGPADGVMDVMWVEFLRR